MENSEKEFTNEMYKLFRERRLAKNKMPIKDLAWLIQGLKQYKKSECTELIDLLRIVLARKKELLLHKDYEKYLNEMYCRKVDHN